MLTRALDDALVAMGTIPFAIIMAMSQNTDMTFSPSCPLALLHAQQVEQAQATSSKIEAELKDLKATLKNIEDARPFNQLTVDDVVAARPEIGRTVDEMVKKGKWTTPGYDEKFGSEY